MAEEKEVRPEDLSGWEGNLARSAKNSTVVKLVATVFGIVFIFVGGWFLLVGNLLAGIAIIGLAIGLINYFRSPST